MTACSKPEAVPEPVRAVRTQVVTAAAASGRSQEFSAELRARVESRLSFRVPGRMTQRSAEVGQRVQAGQVLARLDGTDLKLGQDAARASVQAAESQWALGQAELRRYQDLRQQGFISALELERRSTAVQAQRAQLDQAQAQLSVQGNQAGYANLMSPAAGVVTAVEAEVGTVLSAGTPVLRLAHDGPRDAVFSVPEQLVGDLRRLVGVQGAVRVKAWLHPALYPATVREVSAAADAVTRTYLIKAEVQGQDWQLGQTLTVRLEQAGAGVGAGAGAGAAFRLPLSAVQEQQGRAAVWVLDTATMTVRPQPVTVAAADGNQVLVTQGLAAGQTVVTAGVHALTAGQKVKRYDEGGTKPATVPVAASGAATSGVVTVTRP